jgi:hypothetical protein
MSLGGAGESDIMDGAIAGAVGAGVTFVLAAGNRGMDVDNYHPAGQPDAITVSALADFDGEPGGLAGYDCGYVDEVDDTLADFSNYGAGVDIAAPGVCILSTYPDDRYARMSGTSMAAPHVSGAAAILASTGEHTPAGIKLALVEAGNKGYTWFSGELDDHDGIQEPLLDISSMTVFDPNMVPSVSPIQLEAFGYTESGYQKTDLSWTESGLDTEIYRDGVGVWTVAAPAIAYTDEVCDEYDNCEKGSGMHYYWVCQTGAETICSDVVMVDTY